MKNTYHLQSVVIAFLLVLVSCEKETALNTDDSAKGTLSFGSLISQFDNNSEKTWLTDEVPTCKTDSPKYVRVALKYFDAGKQEWKWYKNSNSDKIEIEVNPNGTDTNNDGQIDSWFTKESLDLELNVGEYSLEYFAVTDGVGEDSQILYLAPRKEENAIDPDLQPVLFHNFVNDPLPVQISIGTGVKYYQPVEVLCYDDAFFFNFGYLFFDFNSQNLRNLCIYGNYCQQNGKHIPAQFKTKVWKGDNYNDANLLVSAENKLKSFTAEDGSFQYYTEAICFPLPDIELYSAKIWLVEENKPDLLIRKGTFSKNDLDLLFEASNNFSYYHFREGCCETFDNFSLLLDLTDNNEGDCEEPEDLPVNLNCSLCEADDVDGAKIKQITFKYIGTNDISLSVSYKGGPNNYNPINAELKSSGDEITINGGYIHSSHGQIIGNNLKFEIENHPDEEIHTSCSEPLYLGLKTNLGGSTNNGSFEIIQIEMSNGDRCPLPPD